MVSSSTVKVIGKAQLLIFELLLGFGTECVGAVLAGVSKPTVIRFELQEKNITLNSAFSILKQLGLFG